MRGLRRLQRRRRRSARRWRRWPRSSSRASTPRPTADWTRSAATTSSKGTLAIANAKLAYQTYKELFSGSGLGGAREVGASPQRCLWASTSTKNPAYRDVVYVEELIGPETVNTMPRETIEAFQDHGQSRTRSSGTSTARGARLSEFAEAGIDYDDVVAVLEREGVEKFAKSFRELFDGVASKRDELVAA